MAGIYGMITVVSDSPKELKGMEPVLTVPPAPDPSAETEADIAAKLALELSEALEQAVGEHDDDGTPGAA